MQSYHTILHVPFRLRAMAVLLTLGVASASRFARIPGPSASHRKRSLYCKKHTSTNKQKKQHMNSAEKATHSLEGTSNESHNGTDKPANEHCTRMHGLHNVQLTGKPGTSMTPILRSVGCSCQGRSMPSECSHSLEPGVSYAASISDT